jgi:hypothetical protein
MPLRGWVPLENLVGEQGEAEQTVTRYLNRQGIRRTRRRNGERQHSEPDKAESPS